MVRVSRDAHDLAEAPQERAFPGIPAPRVRAHGRMHRGIDNPCWLRRRIGVRFFPVEPKSCFHAGDFVARRGAIASICRRPASLDLGLAFRWPISRARRQMRGDRIKRLGLRTYRTSCMNATDSICRRARMESQSVVKRGQWARVVDKSNRSRSACGNATCGTFQHFQIAPVR